MTVTDRRYGVAEGQAVKTPCAAATTANITLAGEQTVDGVALTETSPPMRVLVKNQTDATENGIYDVSTGNWTRTRDFDGALDIVTGTRVFVSGGSVSAGLEYYVSTANPIVIDTTSIAFASSQSTVVAAAAAAAASATNAAASNTSAAAHDTVAAASAVAAASSAASFINNLAMNVTIVESHAGGALTVAIKTLAGANPSAGDPVYFLVRDATAGVGDYVVRTVTSALSIFISQGSTLGFSNATPGRLWLVAFDDGGTIRLGLINCLSNSAGAISIYSLSGWSIASSVADDAGGGSDLAQTFYTPNGHALTSKAYHVLGYLTWEAGLTAAGTWDTAPTRIELYRAGVPLPGQEIQAPANSTGAVATGTTVIPEDDTIPQNTEGDQYMSQAITPSSAANVLEISSIFTAAHSAGTHLVSALFQDSVANALAVTPFTAQNTGIADSNSLLWRMLAATTALTTFKLRIGSLTAGTTTFNGFGAARKYGGAIASFIRAREIMG